ncbi:Beta-mannosidase [Clonorchis sinensis]|uniref:Beta-mannosidase n=1 Tax=Clonorchis sinensis TaxID=79923 RepID=A0A8T1MUC7_CLOSI|nr:Beta-mannosidase [Clonorchis sinensis]
MIQNSVPRVYVSTPLRKTVPVQMSIHTGLILLSFYLVSAHGLPYQTRRLKLSGVWYLIGSSGNWPVVCQNSGVDAYSTQWIAGLIGDPLVDQHDTKYRYIGRENWTFLHHFRFSPTFGSPTGIELRWDGVDTFCDVTLNDARLGFVNNSFLSFEWAVEKHIRPNRTNTLRLDCHSTILVASDLAQAREKSGLPRVPPECWPDNFHGECNINLIRTTQASFGWDWGPALPTQGFWSLPQLVLSYASVRFGEGFKFYSIPGRSNGRVSYSTWSAHAVVELVPVGTDEETAQTGQSFCINFELDQSLNIGNVEQCFVNVTLQKNQDFSILLFERKGGIQPWWPNGIETGPCIYKLQMKLTTLEGHLIDRAKHLIGFREVELVEEWVRPESPELGRSFYFRINGLPIFAKGTNWIPSRLLPGRSVGFMRNSTSDPLWADKRLLRSAALSGTNMVRIWGGGRYESAKFYEEADKLGLMIWHDMMFAVSTYPATGRNDTLDTVEREIRRQIRRLHAHPSIIVWATDNEVKQAISDGWYAMPMDANMLNAFRDRFIESVAEVIRQEERFADNLSNNDFSYQPRRCLISSPGNGMLTEQMHGLDENPQDQRYGDVHFYRYTNELWSETVYPVTRFTSEFGVQSLPSPLAWFRSLSDPAKPDNWNVRGLLMKNRQHHTLGFLFLDLAAEVIGAPTGAPDMVTQYAKWTYVTQLYQLMSYRAHINRLMRHQCRLAFSDLKPVVPSSMGSAYWQLNDVWAAPTWSTIDAAGQWKMAHYGAVRDCYANHPTGRIAIHSDESFVEADWIPFTHVGNQRNLPDYFLLRCFSTDEFSQTRQWSINVDWRRADITCPVRVLKAPTYKIIQWCGWFPTAKFSGRVFQVDIVKGSAITQGGAFTLLDIPINVNWTPSTGRRGVMIQDFHEIPFDSQFDKAPFTATRVFSLTIVTQLPELYIWLDLDIKLNAEHWYDQNAFNMLDVSTKRVKLYTVVAPSVSKAEIEAGILVTTLSSVRQ